MAIPMHTWLQADALGALHSLCQLSRTRQEQAAEQRAAAALVAIALQHGPPAAQAGASQHEAEAALAAWSASHALAVSLLCTFGEQDRGGGVAHAACKGGRCASPPPAGQATGSACACLPCRPPHRAHAPRSLQRTAARAAAATCGRRAAWMRCWHC